MSSPVASLAVGQLVTGAVRVTTSCQLADQHGLVRAADKEQSKSKSKFEQTFEIQTQNIASSLAFWAKGTQGQFGEKDGEVDSTLVGRNAKHCGYFCYVPNTLGVTLGSEACDPAVEDIIFILALLMKKTPRFKDTKQLAQSHLTS